MGGFQSYSHGIKNISRVNPFHDTRAFLYMKLPLLDMILSLPQGGLQDYPHLPTCQGMSLDCMTEVFSKTGNYKTILGSGKVCMPACEDQVYQMEVTSSAFPNRATFPKREEQCLLIMKLRVMP